VSGPPAIVEDARRRPFVAARHSLYGDAYSNLSLFYPHALSVRAHVCKVRSLWRPEHEPLAQRRRLARIFARLIR